MKRVSRLGQGVIAPRALPSDLHEAGTPEVAEMPGCRWLGHSQDAHEIAHAQLAAPQQVQNPQTCPIRERAEEAIDGQPGCLEHSSGQSIGLGAMPATLRFNTELAIQPHSQL